MDWSQEVRKQIRKGRTARQRMLVVSLIAVVCFVAASIVTYYFYQKSQWWLALPIGVAVVWAVVMLGLNEDACAAMEDTAGFGVFAEMDQMSARFRQRGAAMRRRRGEE